MKKLLPILLLLAFLSGCATSGAKLSSIDSGFPQIGSDKGRLYFYREEHGAFGIAMRPDILIDGVVVGKSIPGGVFYSDVSTGEHVVTIPVYLYPGQSSLSIKMQPGQVKYIKTWIGGSSFAGKTNIAVSSEEEARVVIGNLSYTGETK